MRLALAAILGGIAMFFWGFVFWSFLPGPVGVFQSIPEAGRQALIDQMQSSLTNSGVYFYPLPPADGPEDPDFVKAHQTGPLVQMHYRSEGFDPMRPSVMIFGFLHMLLSAAIAASMVRCISGTLRTYKQRVAFVTGMGVLMSLWVEGSQVIWFHHSLFFRTFYGVYHVTAWIIAGLVIAVFTGPGSRPAEAT